ncbi:MAG: lytic transglycosylase domain-containing protein [Candidatus Zixiibacteriota bacterium]|nr:MAG: lytic transglycosylase domain-containing protein [candidate division Zixibacteria bacterium]
MFVDMFDMEVARKLTSSSGRSIAQILYESLEKLIDARKKPDESEAGPIPLKQPDTGPVELNTDGIGVPEADDGFIDHERPTRFAPVAQTPRAVRDDPIMARFGRHIYEAAEETGLDSVLIASVIRAESNGDPSAVSSAGAKGLMQLTDSTAVEVGVSDQFDPRANIQGGSRYLRKMFDRFGRLDLALAAYNAGPANVDRYGGVPPFKETVDYITRVTSHIKAHGAFDTGKS